MKTALKTAAWPALGLMSLLGSLPMTAHAQDAATLPTTVYSAPAAEPSRLYKLPLAHATPAFIVQKLGHVYYINPRPGGFRTGFGSSSGFAQTADALTPSPLRLDGVRFVIDNERDNSLVVEATPEGFMALKAVVSALDVPETPRAKPVKPVAAARRIAR